MHGRFVEQALGALDFDYRVSEAELENIPASGRVIIVANHPIGSLDGLALLRLLGRIRPDVKIVANQLLAQIAPLRPLLLPVDNLGGKTDRRAILAMGEHLAQEGALIIFPAGEVSRLGPKGVKDGPWQGGFIKLARRTRTPLVPIHLDGRNGLPFYLASWLHKPASALLLVRQLFRQQGRRISLTLGERIPPQSLGELAPKTAAALVRRHLYRLGKGKKGPLATEAPIALPEERRQLKQAIDGCELLGQTPDGQRILLYRRHEQGHSVILRELGRLREIAFRAVGEGSGKRRDLDGFDDDYHHLILWDPARLEIIGAYRFAPVAEAARAQGIYVRGAMSCTVGCPYEGEIAPERVAYLAGLMKGIGVQHVGVADTIGVGTPVKVRKAIEATLQHFAIDDVSGHFHDTYGQAVSNTLAALSLGVWQFDTSVAGLGGCPYAKGATGNVATEDVVYMLQGMGIETGIDLDKLIDAGQFISDHLGRPTQSRVAKALLTKRASASACEAV